MFPMKVAVPKLAATIVLLASSKDVLPSASTIPRDGNDIQVLMMERHGKARFMPNMYVFPGGGFEPEDHAMAPAMLSPGYSPLELLWQTGKLAALRELSEEMSCVLTQSGRLVTNAQWQAAQQANSANSNTQSRCYDVEGCSLLEPLGRWVTPESMKYRYDTFFFGATLHSGGGGMPPPQAVSLQPQQSEVAKAVWVSPLDALRHHENAADRFELPPPTYFLLHSLAQQPSFAAVHERWSAELARLKGRDSERQKARTEFFSRIPLVNTRKRDDDEKLFNLSEDYFVGMGEGGTLPRGQYEFPVSCVNQTVVRAKLRVGDSTAPGEPVRQIYH